MERAVQLECGLMGAVDVFVELVDSGEVACCVTEDELEAVVSVDEYGGPGAVQLG